VRPPTLPMLALIEAALALGASACSSGPSTRPDPTAIQSGVIESIEGNSPRQVSALTGMLVGGVLGNASVGNQHRETGFALGALGGAWAIGTGAQGSGNPGYRVTVRFDDGALGYFDNKDPVSIRVGQRVMLSGHRLFESTVLAGSRMPSSAEAMRTSY